MKFKKKKNVEGRMPPIVEMAKIKRFEKWRRKSKT